MMRKSRSRFLLGAAILAVFGYGCLWWTSSPSRFIPGTYTGMALDDKTPTVDRFAADGTYSMDWVPPGETRSKTATRGRWRASGRVLVIETGATAATPIGPLQRFTERFSDPIATPEMTRMGIVSADDTKLVLSYGKDVSTGAEITQTLTRQVDAP